VGCGARPARVVRSKSRDVWPLMGSSLGPVACAQTVLHSITPTFLMRTESDAGREWKSVTRKDRKSRGSANAPSFESYESTYPQQRCLNDCASMPAHLWGLRVRQHMCQVEFVLLRWPRLSHSQSICNPKQLFTLATPRSLSADTADWTHSQLARLVGKHLLCRVRVVSTTASGRGCNALSLATLD